MYRRREQRWAWTASVSHPCCDIKDLQIHCGTVCNSRNPADINKGDLHKTNWLCCSVPPSSWFSHWCKCFCWITLICYMYSFHTELVLKFSFPSEQQTHYHNACWTVSIETIFLNLPLFKCYLFIYLFNFWGFSVFCFVGETPLLLSKHGHDQLWGHWGPDLDN